MRCIDLFAGMGGFSLGAKLAGCHVLWAANHWPAAVSIHAANHPDTQHLCQDVNQANWLQVPKHDLLLASPACQGHSLARGKDQVHHDADRSTAYAVLGAVDCHRPPYVLVENVPAFLNWDGYPGWELSMTCFGYELTTQILDSADFGVPQSRPRLFICASRRGKLPLLSPRLPHVPAAELVDWSHPKWSPVAGYPNRPRALDTLSRIEWGRRKYGSRFLVAYYGSEDRARPITKPVGTLSTRDRFGVVDGDRMRMLTLAEVREAMGFPADYQLPSGCVDVTGKRLSAHKAGVKMLGNAVPPPMAQELIRQIQEDAKRAA